MSEIGSDEPEESGMQTKIVAVDGADGLTPDMLRKREEAVELVSEYLNPKPYVDETAAERRKRWATKDSQWYFQDRMHD